MGFDVKGYGPQINYKSNTPTPRSQEIAIHLSSELRTTPEQHEEDHQPEYREQNATLATSPYVH